MRLRAGPAPRWAVPCGMRFGPDPPGAVLPPSPRRSGTGKPLAPRIAGTATPPSGHGPPPLPPARPDAQRPEKEAEEHGQNATLRGSPSCCCGCPGGSCCGTHSARCHGCCSTSHRARAPGRPDRPSPAGLTMVAPASMPRRAARGKPPPHPLQSAELPRTGVRSAGAQRSKTGAERNTTRKPKKLTRRPGRDPSRYAQRALPWVKPHEPPRTSRRIS